MGMLDAAPFRPSQYQWAVDATKKQQQLHWLAEEVPMKHDVKDWNLRMTPEEKNLGTNIMLLFTQSDVRVGDGYVDHYLKWIKNGDIRRMLASFTEAEVRHVFAYANLLDTLGFPETAYSEFASIPEMKAKDDHLSSIQSDGLYSLALSMATYGGFTEGLQLYGSFIMLLNFQRFGRLKGMGQMVAWSVRDEDLHCKSISMMHRVFCQEYLTPAAKSEMVKSVKNECVTAVDMEDAFIDKAYEMGPVQGLTKEGAKLFIRYLADRRLEGLGYSPLFGIAQDPEPWFAKFIGGKEHANFFEAQPTAYSKGAAVGSYSYDD